MPHVLLVTYEFPPKGGPGVQRPLKLAKYLPDLGWGVTVLTVDDPPAAIMDPALLDEVPPSVRILRAWSLEPTRMIQALQRLKAGSRHPAAGRPASSGGYSGASPWAVRLVQSLFVPDEKRYWKPWAVRAGLRVASGAPFDVVLSSGPPHTAHLVGARIAGRLGIPHVVDFRDPWVGSFSKSYMTPLHRAADRVLERRVITGASALVTVTEQIADTYRERFPRTRVIVIQNGFDPLDVRAVSARPHEGLVLAYTGTFSGPRQPESFLAGLARAEVLVPEIARDVRVVAAGPGPEFIADARRLGVTAQVEALGYVEHRRSLQVLADADVAVLILSAGEESEASLSGKVFEYIGMRKPVLAVVGNGPAGDLVRGLSGGRVADFADPDSVASAIVEIHHDWKSGVLVGPDEAEAAHFSRADQARVYSGILGEELADD